MWSLLLITVLSNVELLTARKNYLAWCDTIECLLLFKPPSSVIPGKPSKKFIYVPSKELIVRWGNGSVDKLLEERYKQAASNHMYNESFSTFFNEFTFSYTYIAELGRFQDIIIPAASVNRPVAQSINFLTDEHVYTIYSFEWISNRVMRCMDKYGYPTKPIHLSMSCMTLHNMEMSDNVVEEYYSGPVTWNRIRFNETTYLLRYLLTNSDISAASVSDGLLKPSMKDYVTCRHLDTVESSLESKCYSVYGVFSYSRVCCCYHKDCHNMQPDKEDLRTYTICPYGEYNSEDITPTVKGYGLEGFARNIVGLVCKSGECAQHTATEFPKINNFYGNIMNKVEPLCKRLSFINNEFKVYFCMSFVDIVKNRTVVLEQYNNIYLNERIFRFIIQDGKDMDPQLAGKKFDINIYNGYVMDSIRSECNATEIVYDDEEIGVNKIRTWIGFRCEWKNCDALFDGLSAVRASVIILYKPYCFFLNNEEGYMKRVGGIGLDTEVLKGHMILGENVETGFCVMRYMSPDSYLQDPVYGYELRKATNQDYDLNIICPNFGLKSHETCIVNDEFYTLCCLPYFMVHNKTEYKEQVIQSFMKSVSKWAVSTSASGIANIVKEPGLCEVDVNREQSSDVCPLKPGCFIEYLFSTQKNMKNSGCTQTGVTATQKMEGIHKDHIHLSTICDLHFKNDNYVYRDQCIVVNNGIETLDKGPVIWGPDTVVQGWLRSTKMLCCCSDFASCSDTLFTGVIYYKYYLDENQEDWDLNTGGVVL
ncbi:unnamed protein product [Bursaphelenchus okinawaensis]|uniref:Uncharacterized protein n=1 Tax=Bursaphelenchus okinawaensis TaxID=465554 RepID=A0A811JUH2_9BILA|nr:unnamed protein product [Bursaphelenchus okinawaensis]CAG9083647.1 unnamed protein product [Bursaphelenchus okinawaensis]